MTKNYYQILGVEKTASDDEIKKAYRRLAMKHHPDRGGDQNEFQNIQEAYAVLSDPQKRQQYDNPQPEFQGQGIPPGFEDLFRHFNFNGEFNPFGGGFRQRTNRNRTLNLQTNITLEEAFSGKELIANIQLPSGKEQIINVKIPAGVQNENILRLSGIGDDSIPNIPRGDVHLTVNVMPHPYFQRQGDDLLKEVEISAFDAMLGCQVPVNTIDNRTLNVNVNAGTQHGTMLAAQGHGMPNVNDNRFRGRLLLRISVKIPTNLTDQQKELLEQARK